MHGKPLTILVVDPDPLICQPLAEMLCLLGHAASAASTLTQAASLLESLPFDVAVVSVNTHPALTGASFLKLARSLQPAMRLVGISASTQPDDMSTARLDGVLHKPFTLEQLQATVTGCTPSGSGSIDAN